LRATQIAAAFYGARRDHAATILSSQRAVGMSVYVVRAFVKIRRESLANAPWRRARKISKRRFSRTIRRYAMCTKNSNRCCYHHPKSRGAESDFIPKKIKTSGGADHLFFKNAKRPEIASAATPIAIQARCSLAHNCGLHSFARASKAPCAP